MYVAYSAKRRSHFNNAFSYFLVSFEFCYFDVTSYRLRLFSKTLNSNIRSQLQLAFTVSNYSSKMNLCGGIAGVTDHELVFRFPDEEFSVSSRKKKSSSSSTSSRRDKSTSGRSSLRGQSSSTSRHPTRSSRGSGITPSNQLSTSTSPASALNPISRHDYEKQRIKNQSRPSRGMKSASILTRKLESGFNLVSEDGR